jgi:hypothetical protein
MGAVVGLWLAAAFYLLKVKHERTPEYSGRVGIGYEYRGNHPANGFD